jgi:hypothetical protein
MVEKWSRSHRAASQLNVHQQEPNSERSFVFMHLIQFAIVISLKT